MIYRNLHRYVTKFIHFRWGFHSQRLMWPVTVVALDPRPMIGLASSSDGKQVCQIYCFFMVRNHRSIMPFYWGACGSINFCCKPGCCTLTIKRREVKTNPSSFRRVSAFACLVSMAPSAPSRAAARLNGAKYAD